MASATYDRNPLAPLTPSQRALWFLDRLHPGTAEYNVPYAVRLTGPLDVEALRAALSAVAARHGVLRTIFPVLEEDGATGPCQLVGDRAEVPLLCVDLMAGPAAGREDEAWRIVREWAEAPFDLVTGPLFRAGLVRLADEEHVLGLFLHHIVCDGASIRILLREIGAAYSGLPAGVELPLQYADHARETARPARSGESVEWWRRALEGAPTTLPLPTDRRRPAVRSTAGATHASRLPAGLVARAAQLARSVRATPFVVMTAAYAALLSRLTGARDLLIGTPVDDRGHEDLEPLIGFFVNTVPLRIDLSGDPTFRELLGRVRSAVFTAVAHGDTPFDTVVEALRVERDPAVTPLVQTCFTFESEALEPPAFTGLTARLVPLIPDTAKFDLDVMIVKSPGGADYDVRFTYSTALFDEDTVARHAERFRALLAAAVDDPDRRLHRLPLLTPAESDAAERDWNPAGASPATGPDACRTGAPLVHEAPAAWARSHPDAPALRCAGQEWSYSTLDAYANGLAHHLTELGVGPGDVVGLMFTRGTDMVGAVLGVLKSGAAYLPLDPLHPAEHLARVLRRAGARLVLTHEPTAHRTSGLNDVTVLRVDVVRAAPRREPPPLRRPVHPEDLAYVIFTSGSTGTPKGVGVRHAALAGHARAVGARYGLRAEDRVLQFTNIAFDVAAEELFPTWASGGCVVIAPEPPPAPERLTGHLDAESVTVANLPAGYWQRWAAAVDEERASRPESLRLLVVGSEPVDPGTLSRWCAATGVPVVNAYGLTETTITSLTHHVGTRFYEPVVPVGSPLGGARAYVLDADLCQLPPGVPGELYIGGDGLARGYLGLPDRTAERFLPDPYAPRPGGRMHRTGDLARRRADGTVEILGRLDDQLKVQGYRIEPAEVEAALAAHPEVVQAAVAAKDGPDGVRRLVGYVVTRGGDVPQDLRARLSATLPAHLVPGALTCLPELPLTSGGKVNRGALPAPAAPAGTGDRRQPGSALEEDLAGLWRQVLHLDAVSVDDNFFDLGGTSFTLAAVHARLTERLGQRLPLVTLYEYPTIASLAEHLGGAGQAAAAGAADHAPQRLHAQRLQAGRARLSRRRQSRR